MDNLKTHQETNAFIDNEVNLFEIWNSFIEFKWTILIITLLCFGATTGVAFIMTPKYKAEVLAMSTDDTKNSGGLASIAGQFSSVAEMAGINLGGGTSGKEAAMAYLRSRIFIETYIKEKDLLPILYAGKWDDNSKKWKVEDPKHIPSLWDAYQLFSKRILAVSADKKTGLISLSIEWKDRERAVEWANDLVKRANANLRQRAIEEAELNLGYLEKELQKTSVVEVQQAIFKVMESQIKTKMMANVQEQFAFKVIDPAAVMGEDAYVKPQRPIFMVLGLLGGFILGVLTAFIRKMIQTRRAIAH